jgi:hypothetical protein
MMARVVVAMDGSMVMNGDGGEDGGEGGGDDGDDESVESVCRWEGGGQKDKCCLCCQVADR